MTRLRKQFEDSRDAYESLHYRGDLARDVLGAMPLPIGRGNGMRRALAIAAALALSATTFFAGRHLGQPAAAPLHESIAFVTQTPSPLPAVTDAVVASKAADEEAFSLVPALATISTPKAAADASAAPSRSQSSMDFSLTVPTTPMLFSLATLADQEQTTTADADTSEKRS